MRSFVLVLCLGVCFFVCLGLSSWMLFLFFSLSILFVFCLDLGLSSWSLAWSSLFVVVFSYRLFFSSFVLVSVFFLGL